MTNTLVGVFVGFSAIVLLCVVIVFNRRRRPPAIVVESLSLADVVRFFKRQEVAEKLKTSTNVIAVALKEKRMGGRVGVSLCTFDKVKNVVCEPLAVYDASRLDDSLLNAFGDKDMIVLQ